VAAIPVALRPREPCPTGLDGAAGGGHRQGFWSEGLEANTAL
jgi:hypothetical protein